MNTIPNALTKDFATTECKKKLIELYGESKSAFGGKNEDGEDVLVSISKTGICVTTFQSNGWTRVNYYDVDGLPAGETFEGRWREKEV